LIERKRIDAVYAHRAWHDPLTDLPNRMLFVDRLAHALARIERTAERLALLFIDLDGFKDVNDSFGHDVGDSVLMALSERIRQLLRPSDTVARFGGDEFTILCEDLKDERQAMGIAQRILEIFSEPLIFDDLKMVITPSIGIAMAKGSYERPETLLRNADIAMYRAKERGGACYQVFDESLRSRALHRRGMEWKLRRAIEANQLRVFYQPSLSLRDGSIVGLEALVRWEHPDRGLLGPNEFIPLAEETGLVIPMGQWVFLEACRQRARWRERFPDRRLPDLWVNLSSRQLNYADLPERLSEAMHETGIDPSEIWLEITETVLIDDEAAVRELKKLHALGVSLSIDDFGTGYSSLTCLKRLPVAQIKLDRSFVAGLGRDAPDGAIVAGVIDMAHALGLTVAAEGVETEHQLEHLKRLRCDCAQGFFFACPQPADAITVMIEGFGMLQPA
jgi:diguanylate cyclase (GGDEF)-like protein